MACAPPLLPCVQLCGSNNGSRLLEVASAQALLEALAAAATHEDGCSSYIIQLSANITLGDLVAPPPQQQPQASIVGRRRLSALPRRGLQQAPTPPSGASSSSDGALYLAGAPFLLPVNVTLRGSQGANWTVLDTALVQSLVSLGPGAFLGLEGLTLVNLALPLPGLMATPMYLLQLPDRCGPGTRSSAFGCRGMHDAPRAGAPMQRVRVGWQGAVACVRWSRRSGPRCLCSGVKDGVSRMGGGATATSSCMPIPFVHQCTACLLSSCVPAGHLPAGRYRCRHAWCCRMQRFR